MILRNSKELKNSKESTPSLPKRKRKAPPDFDEPDKLSATLGSSAKGSHSAERAFRRPSKRKGESLKILQLNMGRAKIVNDELRHALASEGIDVALVQEPYTHLGKVPGMGINVAIVTGAKPQEKPWAATAIANGSLVAIRLTDLCTPNCTCTQISGSFGDVYLVSLYCQFQDNISVYLEHLEVVLNRLNGKRILIAADANAKSEWWGSKTRDAQGELLEDFIIKKDLVVLNERSNLKTCRSTRGETNIDVTLVTPNLLDHVAYWHVEDWSSSDHRPILIGLDFSSFAKKTVPMKSSRFNIAKADWESFERHLRAERVALEAMRVDTPEDVERLANAFEGAIISACNKAIPQKRTRQLKPQIWWNSELSKLKERAQKHQKEYMRYSLHSTRDSYATPEKRAKIERQKRKRRDDSQGDYERAVRKAKRESWQNFVTEEANKNVWSLPYKLASGKMKVASVMSNILTSSGATTDWQETSNALIHGLVPDDDIENETEEHERIRLLASLPADTPETPPFTQQEVLKALWKNKVGKSPGTDRIEVAALKKARPLFGELTRLYNECLKYGVFPKSWKKGSLTILHKAPEKDETAVKSYRPICLLSVMGKTLERLMVSRLQPEIGDDNALTSNDQYGFKTGRSTEDAIVRLTETAEGAKTKYVMAFPLDMSGAFDNLWWPSLLKNLRDRGCPSNIFRLFEDYFRDREVCYKANFNEVSKKVTKGCPQGSIFGPVGWNVELDGLLLELKAAGFDALAYADDITVVIQGNSRREIQERGQVMINIVQRWCELHKHTVSAEKSGMILLKGSLNINRPPTIKLGNKSIRMYKEMKYLGVTFAERLKVNPHVDNIYNKCMSRYNQISKMARSKWGLKFKALKQLYKCLFLPIVSYACAGWFKHANSIDKRKLLRLQRRILKWKTHAYNNTSTEALQVLGAAMPIDLELMARVAEYNIRKKRPISVYDVKISAQDLETGAISPEDARRRVREVLVAEWQRKWDSSEHGRVTHRYFSSVKQRLESEWLEPNYYTSQFLTGHGAFKAHLKRFKRCDDSRCSCGAEQQTADHILFECNRYDSLRVQLVEAAQRAGHTWPCSASLLVDNKDVYQAFNDFARNYVEQVEGRKHRAKQN